MFKVVKEVRWEAAHRLFPYIGRCANIHGHSWRAIFTFQKENVNDTGMVIDFTNVKKVVRKWIDAKWDHACILCYVDPLVTSLNITDNKIFTLGGNPTSENMAKFLFDFFTKTFQGIDSELKLESVEVFESATSSAIYKS